MKDNYRLLKLVPKLGPNDAQSILGDTEKWFNFARRVQHNPEMKSFLHSFQKGACPACALGLEGELTVHHVSYMNRCLHNDPILIPNPTKSRPNRTTKAPPCKGCSNISKCASYLSLVHSRCHIAIHTLERQLKST